MNTVQNANYISGYSYSASAVIGKKDAEEYAGEAKENLTAEHNKEGEKEAGASLCSEQETGVSLCLSKDKEKEWEEQQFKSIQDTVSGMQSQSQSIKNCFDSKNQKNLYDATSDLMAIANAEREPALKAIHTRLLFKARMMKMSGAKSDEIKIAVTKIKKVIGKVKTKIKKLKKEEQIEKKRKNAEKARQRKLEEELRRELALRKKVRKNREQKDVEESRMGLGANYGGPSAGNSVSLNGAGALTGGSADVTADELMLFDEGMLMDSSMVSSETGLTADAGPVTADVGAGTIDVLL